MTDRATEAASSAPPAAEEAEGSEVPSAPPPGEESFGVVEIVPGPEAVVTVATTPEEREEVEPAPAAGNGEPPAPLQGEGLVRAALALVFASPDPVPTGRLAAALRANPGSLREALEEARRRIGGAGLPFELTEVGGGWRFLTQAEFEPWIARLQGLRRSEKLSPAAVETLAIVAYRQPVTKAEIEAVRGVQAAPILRSLLDRRLVRVLGRAPVPGRPLQYGTTRDFLDRFGLRAVGDLPKPEELARG